MAANNHVITRGQKSLSIELLIWKGVTVSERSWFMITPTFKVHMDRGTIMIEVAAGAWWSKAPLIGAPCYLLIVQVHWRLSQSRSPLFYSGSGTSNTTWYPEKSNSMNTTSRELMTCLYEMSHGTGRQNRLTEKRLHTGASQQGSPTCCIPTAFCIWIASCNNHKEAYKYT